MKTQLSAIDLHYLAKELDGSLRSARFDRTYQMGEKDLKIRFHSSGKGSAELVLTPSYCAITRYARKAPERPTSFAMQLRKHLDGAYVKEIRQHGFDRILEIAVQGKERDYLLIAEFFSRGNIVFCNSEYKILGLLEWQKWKDRTLGVGQTYQYPPGGPDPLTQDENTFDSMLATSSKKLASALATDAGLGGLYAEEVCFRAGIKKETIPKDLSAEEREKVRREFVRITGSIRGNESKPAIITKDGINIDVVPAELGVYGEYEKTGFGSFNDAVDEFFSHEEFKDKKEESDGKLSIEMGKLREIESKQNEIILRFEKESVESKEIGNIIYQNYPAIEELMKGIKEAKEKGASWEDIKNRIRGKEYAGMRVEDLDNMGRLTLKAGK